MNKLKNIEQILKNSSVSDRIFDAQHNIEKHIAQILLEYKIHGHLHIINTGLKSKEDLINIMPEIGFSEERAFNFGGRASDQTQEKWIVKNKLRRLDYYPPEYYLLPNTEVQYLKITPKDVLFFVNKAPDQNSGGRIFLHSVKEIEQYILEKDSQLILDIKKFGLKITTGYVDENHVNRSTNYMKSWQEISGESNIDLAVQKLSLDWINYTNVWKEKLEDGSFILMTTILNPGFSNIDNSSFITIPRIAMTEPSLQNGFRKFTLGNNQALSSKQNEILIDSFLSSRQGSDIFDGDLFLIDNIRTAHSREPFLVPNQRSIFVGMAGVNCTDLSSEQINELLHNEVITEKQLKDIMPKKTNLPFGLSRNIKYETPSVEYQINESFSIPVYNLNGKDLNESSIINDILTTYHKYGRLHITGNTKYSELIPTEILDALGFGIEKQFKWGGLDSGRTVRDPKGNGFHTVDKYPANLTLLPHQEIFYQRILPKHMLFHYRKVSGPGNGGRTLVHSGENLEKLIFDSGSIGIQLIKKLEKYGQLIRTGFLDENHSLKDKNFVRSWQDRFQTKDINEALIKCKNQSTHFDNCWAHDTGEKDANGNPIYMLMTEITIPVFKKLGNKRYMMFPRISYNEPSIINGLREFKIGNNEEFSVEEITILLEAFWKTREGHYQSPGDILLINNLKFGHSREPYLESNGIRDAVVIMAEEFIVDDL